MNRKMRLIEKVKEICGSRYRMRISIFFFAVAVLAIGFIDVAVFKGLSDNIREDSDKEIREMLRSMNASYESQIEQYQGQAQLLYRNLNVKSYLVSGGKEDSHINTIYESMRAMAGNVAGISSVILFHKKDVLASYDTGTVTVKAKEEILKKIADTTTDREMFFVWTDERQSRRQMVTFWSDRDYLYGPSSFGVALVVNMDTVQEKVIPQKQNVENPIYILHKDGEMVVSQKDEYRDEIQRIFENTKKKTTEEESFREKIKGEIRTISYVREKDGRFFSMRIQEVSSSQAQMQRALQTIFVSTILGMLLITVVIWVLSGWMYRPLGAIFRNILNLAQTGEKSVSWKDDLLQATDALEDVNQSMSLLKYQIRNNAVVHFLRQYVGSEESDPDIFEFGTCHPDNFILMVLRYSMDNWSKNEAMLAYLKEIPWKQKEGNNGGIQYYRVIKGEVVILIYTEKDSQGSPRSTEQASKILEELISLYNIKGCIGIAGCYESRQLPKAYQAARNLTEYHILSKNIKVMDQEMLKEKKRGPVQEPERERIIQWVKEDVEDELTDCLHRLFENLISFHIREAQKYLKDMISDVIRLSDSFGTEKNERYKMYLEDFLTNQIFIGQVDIEEWMCSLFWQVKNQIKDGRQSSSVRIMGEVVDYIGRNYWDCGLSAESVAERYGLSVSYFSKLFNNYTEKTFPDYISQLRLQKAREMLLEEQHLTIQEIAMQVGFNSSSYFSSAFRKYYGVSPSQIRKIKNK